jgi:hypothetical protein
MWEDRDEHILIFEEWGNRMVESGILDSFNVIHVLSENHKKTH